MSLIYIPTVSSHKLNQIQFNSKTSVVFPGMSIGEVLEAGVIEKSGDRNMIISLKGINIPADSEVTLHAGDIIKVRVESLHPQVILRIMESGNPEEAKIADYLKWHRSNPDALSHMITEAVKQFSKGNLSKLLHHLHGEDFQKIVTILKSLFLSSETKGNSFVKDYIRNLGLLTESQLRKMFEGEGGVGEEDLKPQNLKSLLMKVSADIHNLLLGKDILEHEEVVKLTMFAEYINSSIKTIESHQVINYILQEAENKYFFQIPVIFPEGPGKGDIFVEYDRDSRKDEHNGQHRVMIFLDMDMLGDMIIEAKLEAGKISCLIKCATQKACDFVSPFLEELRNALLATGSEINALKCVVRDDLEREKADYYRDRVLYAREVIDLFA